ncbi:hypothetical protein M422DRAFT_172975 [Sphaerobolus stellatus SS14]|uniref:Reverse transcriptase domain-containing protein n=1 Tax=Sphaerobolus stellatus (strain SS14) TaxID=990650 RepID=A0A0C9V1L4_SPHS4|nr:hypothetical protein M422DRAFT_172975 [Sphaerobolus stellatus SS14]
MATSAPFDHRQNLRSITSIKLEELEKQRLAYIESQKKVLQKAEALVNDPVAKVELLVKAVRAWNGSGALGSDENVENKITLGNLDDLLLQAKRQPYFNKKILDKWANTLEGYIRHRTLKFEYAKLSGNLFDDWLISGDTDVMVNSTEIAPESIEEKDFVEVGRKEMHEQKARLASLIFEERKIDEEALSSYLSGLFSHKSAIKSLEHLRRENRLFGEKLKKEKMSSVEVKGAMKGLLFTTGLLEEHVRAALREYLGNPVIIEEIKSVLNMRLSAIDTWKWPEEGSIVNLRRHMNGKYRAFTDPHLLDALMLHHLGLKWQVQFNQVLGVFRHSKAWRKASQALDAMEKTRRQQHLGLDDDPFGSIASKQKIYEDQFYLTQLASTMYEVVGYGEDGATYEDPDNNIKATTPASIKQNLLHSIITEAYLNTALHGQHSILCSDLEWFGPSLRHGAILHIFKFFGIPEDWLKFFEKFLKAPIRFKDDPLGEVRVRQCGTPISYTLSTICGEAILFMMDYAVNQKTKGQVYLYRIHDDLWLWNSDPEKCVAAWKEMNIYGSLVGLTFNIEKTGSACVGVAKPEGLPEGSVRWGFLEFDESQGRFVIKQSEVDQHIAELRHQLAATKSVFGWVNIYNQYLSFMLRNFGGAPATCFGPAHISDVIATFKKIHLEAFGTDGPVAQLASKIEAKYGISDIPEGFYYFPMTRGGLGLKNVMIEMFALQKEAESHKEGFTEQKEKDEEVYLQFKKHWDMGFYGGPENAGGHLKRIYNTTEPFMSFEEFKSLRTQGIKHWSKRYEEMFKTPEPVELTVVPAVEAAVNEAGWSWYEMEWYDKWIVTLYAADIMEKFGDMEIADESLISKGMVQLFKSSRTKLDQ